MEVGTAPAAHQWKEVPHPPPELDEPIAKLIPEGTTENVGNALYICSSISAKAKKLSAGSSILNRYNPCIRRSLTSRPNRNGRISNQAGDPMFVFITAQLSHIAAKPTIYSLMAPSDSDSNPPVA
ncbi:unnamed protein product [Linum trigynum]|uniref:Uncharacterized protein n=1 Tax=Linum trigynum TaxID=586398 RepID=A0AAV2DLJ2_9ROSI